MASEAAARTGDEHARRALSIVRHCPFFSSQYSYGNVVIRDRSRTYGAVPSPCWRRWRGALDERRLYGPNEVKRKMVIRWNRRPTFASQKIEIDTLILPHRH